MASRIISTKPRGFRAAASPIVKRADAPAGPPPSPAAAVRRLLVDEGSEGQRLDNFLLKVLKGVTTLDQVIRETSS